MEFWNKLDEVLNLIEEDVQKVNRAIVEKMNGTICGEMVSACLCGESPNHKTPHVCMDPICNGSWTGTNGVGDFRVYRFPQNWGGSTNG